MTTRPVKWLQVATIWFLGAFPCLVFAHGGAIGGPSSPPAAPPPSTPAPSGWGNPRTPPPPGPSGPRAPSGPQSGGSTGVPSPVPGGGTRSGVGARSGFFDPAADLSRWEVWWDFNKHSYLDLRRALFSGGPATGPDSAGSLARETMRPHDAELREKVLPKLFRVLQQERNPDLVTGAMMATAKIGLEAKAASEFARFLSDSNQEISETAALGLGLLRDTRALPTLMGLALDEAQGRSFVAKSTVPLRTRVFAVYALGLFGAESSQDAVTERIVATLRAVSSDKRDLQVARTIALGIVRDPERRAAEELRRLLEDKEADASVRAMAPISLARLLVGASQGGERADHPLLPLVRERVLRLAEDRSEPEWLRSSCIQSLPHFAPGDSAFAEASRKLLMRVAAEARTVTEKNFALIALGRLGGEVAQAELEKHLEKSSSLRPWAALALGVLGRNNSKTAACISQKLRKSLESERNPSTAAALAISLGLLKDAPSSGLLLTRMRASGNEELKGFLALSLGMIGAHEAVGEIAVVAKEAIRRPELQQQAVVALGLLGDRNVAVDLVQMLDEARTLSVQSSLAGAIGWIGDRRSLDPLLPLLEGPRLTPMARAFVAAAIGMIGDPDAVHWSAQISNDLNYIAAPHTLVDRGGYAGLLDIL